MLILEYSNGHKFRKSPPAAFRKLVRPAEALGWWQVAICFVIAAYYAVIIAWAVRYIGYSFGEQWGKDANAFFFGDFLQAAEKPGLVSSYVDGVLWPLIAVWVVVLVILALGIRNGIEKANKFFIPLLVLFSVVLVARALTLDGAGKGLGGLFRPDWSALGDGSVWVAAYGQIFFSLSIGFGIMITYASYLRKRSDLTGSAMVAGFANSAFGILAGIGVFATLGFMASAQGVGVDEVASSGIGLAFVAFPTVISQMPMGTLFGVLFFASLVISGLTSLISIVQVVIAAVQDRTGIRRVPAVLGVGGAIALVSILVFPADSGIYLLDAADHFINQYGIALAALAVLVVVGRLLRGLPALRKHAHDTSAMPVGRWWLICLGIVTPLVLGWLMVDSLRAEFAKNYEGHSTKFLLRAGWGVAAAALLAGVVLSLVPWRSADSESAAEAGAGTGSDAREGVKN